MNVNGYSEGRAAEPTRCSEVLVVGQGASLSGADDVGELVGEYEDEEEGLDALGLVVGLVAGDDESDEGSWVGKSATLI